jgi:hypothetical protein
VKLPKISNTILLLNDILHFLSVLHLRCSLTFISYSGFLTLPLKWCGTIMRSIFCPFKYRIENISLDLRVQKHNTIYAVHHYSQINTNKVSRYRNNNVTYHWWVIKLPPIKRESVCIYCWMYKTSWISRWVPYLLKLIN